MLIWEGDLLTSRVSDIVQAIGRDRMLDWVDHWSVPVWQLPCPYSKCRVVFLHWYTVWNNIWNMHYSLPYQSMVLEATVYLKHPASFIKLLNIF